MEPKLKHLVQDWLEVEPVAKHFYLDTTSDSYRFAIRCGCATGWWVMVFEDRVRIPRPWEPAHFVYAHDPDFFKKLGSYLIERHDELYSTPLRATI